MLRSIVFTVILASAGWLSYQAGQWGAGSLERLTVVRTAEALSVIGLDWATVEVDGLNLRLSGEAPDGFAQELAIETLRSIAPFSKVEDTTTTRQISVGSLLTPAITILRDPLTVTITGLHATEADQRKLTTALRAALGDAEVFDLTEVGASKPVTDWALSTEVAVEAIAQVRFASARVSADGVLLEGLATDENHRGRLHAQLTELAAGKVSLDLRLRSPLPVIAPFRFHLEKHTEAQAMLHGCASGGADEAEALSDMLGRDWGLFGKDLCLVGAGRPDENWLGAVSTGLAALSELPAGSVAIEYRTVELVPSVPIAAALLSEVIDKLRRDLPPGYSLSALTRGEVGVASRDDNAGVPAWMRISRQGQATVLQGLVSAVPERLALETYAAALFGSVGLTSRLEITETRVPTGWQETALAALSGLKNARQATLDMTEHVLTLKAVAISPAQAIALHSDMDAAISGEIGLKTEITVDLPAAYKAQPLTTDRCIVVLNRIADAAQIQFAAGSAVIEDSSAGAVGELAAVMDRCPESVFQIAGHTDSQGPEDFNERLSQARAESVVGALIRAGVSHRRLEARGYGESEPLMSNETPEGRAKNRRIAFRPLL